MGRNKGGVLLDGKLEVALGGVDTVGRQLPPVVGPLEVGLPRLGVDGPRSVETPRLLGGQSQLDLPDDRPCDIALERQDVGDVALEAVDPQVVLAACVDEITDVRAMTFSKAEIWAKVLISSSWRPSTR